MPEAGVRAAVLRRTLTRVPPRWWLYALAALVAPWIAAGVIWYALLPLRLLFGIEFMAPRV